MGRACVADGGRTIVVGSAGIADVTLISRFWLIILLLATVNALVFSAACAPPPRLWLLGTSGSDPLFEHAIVRLPVR